MKKRLVWIDWMKAFLILCVVLGHSGSIFSNFIYTFHIPAFFFISGYLYKYKKGNNLSLIYAIIIYNILFIIINAISLFLINKGIMHTNNEQKNFYEVLIRPIIGIIWVNYNENSIPNPLCSQFWFVWVLIFIRFLHFYTKSLSLKGKVLCFILPIIAVYIESHFHIKTYFYFDRILIAYPFFILGNITKQTEYIEKLIYNSTKTKKNSIIALLLLCALYLVNKLYVNEKFDMFYYKLGENIVWYYLVNILNIFCIIIICSNFRQSKTITDISNGTFLILALHLYIILYLWGSLWYFYLDPTRITMLGCTLLPCILLIKWSQKHLPILIGK